MKSWMLWLAATGYALYYFSSEANEAWLPLLHWVAGLSLPVLLWTHIRRGRARHVTPMPQRSLHHEAPTPARSRVPAAETR